jgi:hypothetical protein
MPIATIDTGTPLYAPVMVVKPLDEVIVFGAGSASIAGSR